MLKIAPDLSTYALSAGEPFLMQVQLLAANSAVVALDDEAIVLTFYDPSTRAIAQQIEGVKDTDETGDFFRFEEDGTFSESLYGEFLRVELSRRYLRGRQVIGDGQLTIASSAASVPSLGDAAIGDVTTRVTIKAAQAIGTPPTISLTAHPYVPVVTSTPTPTPIAGFYANGASNSLIKAAVARVKAGTGRAKILSKSNSTGTGQGAGTGANKLVGARMKRPTALIAAALTQAGLPALDVGVVADNGVDGGANSAAALPDYDPRVTINTWSRQFNQTFAGGGYLVIGDTGGEPFKIEFADAADTFEVVHYSTGNAAYNISLDGATIQGGNSGSTNGFGKTTQVLGAAAAGRTGLLNTVAPADTLALCSFRAWNSKVPAIDFVVDASCGATATQQLGTSNDFQDGWSPDAHLRYEAPDLTMIEVGINDLAQGIANATTIAAIQQGITSAKLSGDVLLIVPHGFNTATASDANQQALNTAIKNLAAQNSVSCLSLYEHFGPFSSTQSKLVDDGIHPTADFYAEIAAVEQQTLQLMGVA